MSSEPWTMEQVAQHYAAHGWQNPYAETPTKAREASTREKVVAKDTGAAASIVGAASSLKRRAGHKRPDGYASAVEARYAERLEQRRRADEIARYWYEPFSLRLAPKTYYRPDWLVELISYRGDGRLLEIHECKGAYVREDGWQKLKIAARLYPCFVFVMCQWKEGHWHYKTLPSR